MVAKTYTVAFQGVDALRVVIEVQITSGSSLFTIVGLADKSVAESRERVRSALHTIGLSLPGKHITVNLAPADMLKEGTHYDLPIVMALMTAMGVLPEEQWVEMILIVKKGMKENYIFYSF